jgi:hypothetical protein
MNKLIRTVLIIGAMFSLTSKATEDVEKYYRQKRLIDTFEVVVETLQRSCPVVREELLEDRFKDVQFVHNLSVDLEFAELLIPDPKAGVSSQRDIFLSEVKTGSVSLAMQHIISWLYTLKTMNGILLTEASLDSKRQKELGDLYDVQARDLSILIEAFNTWSGALLYGR